MRGGIQTTLMGIKQWLTPQVLRKGVIKTLVSENSQVESNIWNRCLDCGFLKHGAVTNKSSPGKVKVCLLNLDYMQVYKTGTNINFAKFNSINEFIFVFMYVNLRNYAENFAKVLCFLFKNLTF